MAIDVKKERRLNDMNALAESIKLGTELRRMDESIPSAEKIADWDGAVEDLGVFYGGTINFSQLDTTFEAGVYTLLYNVDSFAIKAILIVSEVKFNGISNDIKQTLIIATEVTKERFWGGSSWGGWETYSYLSDLTPILSDITALEGKFSTGTKLSNSTGTAGQESYDADYFYKCVATNTWIRFAKTAWE